MGPNEIGQPQVVQAKHEQEIASLELRCAQAIHVPKLVHSPINGIVISTDRTEGGFVEDSDHVAMIGSLRVEAFLTLEPLPLPKDGATMTIVPREPGRERGKADFGRAFL